jgi:hypothetical protein
MGLLAGKVVEQFGPPEHAVEEDEGAVKKKQRMRTIVILFSIYYVPMLIWKMILFHLKIKHKTYSYTY